MASEEQIQTRTMKFGAHGYNSAGTTAQQQTIGTDDPVRSKKVRGNYPSQYNHAVDVRNYFAVRKGENLKRKMRGGRFLLYRKVVFCIAVIAIVFAGISTRWKYFTPIPVVLSLINIIVLAFNLLVGRINGSLLCEDMIPVEQSAIQSTSQLYTVPATGHIDDQVVLESIQKNAALLARVQSQNIGLNDIVLLLYTPVHRRYTEYLPRTVGYIILYGIILVFAVVCASATGTFPGT